MLTYPDVRCANAQLGAKAGVEQSSLGASALGEHVAALQLLRAYASSRNIRKRPAPYAAT